MPTDQSTFLFGAAFGLVVRALSLAGARNVISGAGNNSFAQSFHPDVERNQPTQRIIVKARSCARGLPPQRAADASR